MRDGRYDTGMPPSSHPGYDPSRLCKINDAHLAHHGLRALARHPAVAALLVFSLWHLALVNIYAL